jgi:hypothetical protein
MGGEQDDDYSVIIKKDKKIFNIEFLKDIKNKQIEIISSIIKRKIIENI